jgi:carboxylesterase
VLPNIGTAKPPDPPPHADGLRPDPARDYAEALGRFAKLSARDGPVISSPGRSRFYAHGKRTPLSIVLIHGFTNCPQQWDMFASELQEAGHTIVVPRLPGHGHYFRGTHALSRVTAPALLATVNQAVDIACGAGERVVLAGLSIGGTFAPRIALARADIAHTISIVPFFAPAKFSIKGTSRLAAVLEFVPNFFVSWDPGGDDSLIPSYGYPRFASRMLAESLRIGIAVEAIARERAPAGHTTFMLNAREPACNNAVSEAVRAGFERDRPGSTGLIVLEDLPANHDIIDPTNAVARVDLVYPVLRRLIEATAYAPR